jgi:hypothetical protein
VPVFQHDFGCRVALTGWRKTWKAYGRSGACETGTFSTRGERCSKGQAWVDRGAAKLEQKHAELELPSLKWKALANGLKLAPVNEAT